MADNYSGGFAGGFASGLNDSFQNQDKMAMELKMKSAMIAQQAGMQQQIEQDKFQRENYVDPSVSKSILANLSAPTRIGNTSVPGLDLKDINPNTPLKISDAQELFKLKQSKVNTHMMTATAGFQPVVDETTGITTGKQAVGFAGQPIGKPSNDPAASQKVEQGIGLINAAKDLTQIKQQMQQINFGRLKGFVNNAEAFIGNNADVTNFNSLRTYIATEMPKNIAGFTRFNEPEFQRLADTIPNVHSTPEEVQKWVRNYDSIVGGRMSTLGMNPAKFGVLGTLGGKDDGSDPYAKLSTHEAIKLFTERFQAKLDAKEAAAKASKKVK